MQSAKLVATVLSIFTIVLVAPYIGADNPQPEPTMMLYGYIFIRTVTGQNITAPEGLCVYAKVNKTLLSNTTVLKEGRYTIAITGPENGTAVDLFVQDIEVTTVQYYDWNVTWLNLTVTDHSPPSIEPVSPIPGDSLAQQPMWINASVTDNLAINESTIRAQLNETSLNTTRDPVSCLVSCRVGEINPGFYIINVTVEDLAGNRANEAWNFTLLAPRRPIVEMLFPTSEDPIYRRSGQQIQVIYNYTELYPMETTIDVYNTTKTIGQLFIDIHAGTGIERNDTLLIEESASDGKYTISVTITNIFNLSQKAEQNEAIIVDNTPPTIQQVNQNPSATNVQPTDGVKINATIRDSSSGLLNATLLWRTQDGEWNSAPMSQTSEDVYNGVIPPLQNSTRVFYSIEAFDRVGNRAVEDSAGQFYTYEVLLEHSTVLLMMLFFVLTSTILLSKKAKVTRRT